ncbi:MFS transporter [Rothia nasimurium]|uniref:MFS transporter n=1 Tax=Rothia nasimurium TaxID=85336 RepID=UPI001F00C283|nr:MFS transporter [Rothia nasimurium]
MTQAIFKAEQVMQPVRTTKQKRKAFIGAVAGHLIEWYDYGVYGFVAVYVGAAFFAADTPALALMASFATFALSFFMRPLGGFVFGPLGDKIGRKNTMALVMFLMSGSTFAIGLMPTYATIGVFAPALLILARCLQGLSAGGEIGTVTSYVAEYGGPQRRGLATSILMTIAVSGLILGSIVANGLASILGDQAMQEFGWRIPFLIAGPLGLIAAFIRSRLEDSAQFEAISETGHQEKAPIRATFKWKLNITLVAGSIALLASMFYLILTYSSTYFVKELNFSPTTRFWFITIGGLTAACMMPLGGLITDVLGRRWFLMLTSALHIPALYWYFTTAPGSTPAEIFLPFMVICVLFGLYSSTPYAVMSDLIPTAIRSTGISMGYNIPVAIFGGSAPFIATFLVTQTGDITSPMYFFIGCAVLSFLAALFTTRKNYERVEKADADLMEKVATSSIPVVDKK